MDRKPNPVDIYVYLPIAKTQEHSSVFEEEDERGKAQINEIQKMEKQRIVDDLRRTGVLTPQDEAHFIYQADRKITDTQIEIPSRNFARMTVRYDNRQ